VADVARTLLTMLGDGGVAPLHLPGSDLRTLGALTDAYLAAAHTTLAIDTSLLERWQAIEAVARIAEGVPRAALLEVWRRFEETESGRPAAGQTAAG
jgi:hypothetical protein